MSSRHVQKVRSDLKALSHLFFYQESLGWLPCLVHPHNYSLLDIYLEDPSGSSSWLLAYIFEKVGPLLSIHKVRSELGRICFSFQTELEVKELPSLHGFKLIMKVWQTQYFFFSVDFLMARNISIFCRLLYKYYYIYKIQIIYYTN